MKSGLVINGAAGRMGRRILAFVVEEGLFSVVAATEHSQHPDLGKDAGVLAGIETLNIPLSTGLPKKADVMIDFSLPDAAEATITHCRDNGIALVLGTTGLSKSHFDLLNQAAKKIPIVQATNMSLGMNLLFALVGKVAKSLGEEYDIEIVEAHHRFKKDAPSGSALSLAESVCKETGRTYPDCLVNGREGKDALRKKGEIGMHAVRAGDIVGQHSIIFSTLGETVTIAHNAHTRDTFARGAVRAAGWLVGQNPGLYSMRDVLGLD